LLADILNANNDNNWIFYIAITWFMLIPSNMFNSQLITSCSDYSPFITLSTVREVLDTNRWQSKSSFDIVNIHL
jgi:hypothetical protein